MTTPNGEDSKELADMPQLSDVQATDALLDRLAARALAPDDLDDPIVAELARLAEFADASPVPPLGVERLIEVLGGRPLYMFDRGLAAVSEEDEPIQLGEDHSATRMIDLSSGSASSASTSSASTSSPSTKDGDAEDDADSETDREPGIAARADGSEPGRPAVASLALARSLRLARRPVTKTGWQGVAQQIALPAASVVALLALGGGVSAVVTGDPMSPVYGVTRVASVLPGIDSPEEKKLKSAQSDIRVAASAVQNNQPGRANNYLRKAQNHLPDVPDESKADLRKQISKVKSDLSAAATTPATTAPVPTAAPTTAPVVTTPPTSPPVTTPPTTPPDTTPPTTEPPATTEPSSGADAASNDGGSGAAAP